MKVANCIKLWLEKHWRDDWSTNPVLQKDLEDFLRKVKEHSETCSETPKADAKLVKIIEAKLKRKKNQCEQRRSTIARVYYTGHLGSSVEFGVDLDMVSMAAALTENFNEVFVKI